VVLVTDGMKACFESGRDLEDTELEELQKLLLTLA